MSRPTCTPAFLGDLSHERVIDFSYETVRKLPNQSNSRNNRNDPAKSMSLIAEILDAELRGAPLDRESLIAAHPDLEDSLRDFYRVHDRIKAAADFDWPVGGSREESDVGVDSPTLGDSTLLPHRSDDDEATLASTPVPDPTSAPTVGTTIRYFGDYELLEEIARGGMGIVYKSRQLNLNRIVALKMILAGQFAGEEDVLRFHTEAEAAAQLDHPGIVPIFEIGQYEGQHYFSMGYVDGQSLAEKVAAGPFRPSEAAELVAKISDAMAYAHSCGVIHRDLKPANVLIDAAGNPRVTDFGLAKKTEADSNLTGTGQILGTPAYMPPEQASGKTDEIGPRSDIYSLGAILYCLLTGRPPHQAASPMDTLLQVLEKDPVSPRLLNPQVPQDLETVCLKCLQKDPAGRFQDAAELAEELRRFLRGEPILTQPIGEFEKLVKYAVRNPKVAIPVCTLIVVLSVLIYPLATLDPQVMQGYGEAMSRSAFWFLFLLGFVVIRGIFELILVLIKMVTLHSYRRIKAVTQRSDAANVSAPAAKMQHKEWRVALLITIGFPVMCVVMFLTQLIRYLLGEQL